jgi:iron complex outermembrane recepter protein
VETLLGPQGTLYGAGALAGTIRYVTNQPEFGKTKGRINTSFYQTKYGGLSNDTDGVVNLPIGNDLALRVMLSRLDEKGFTDRFAGTPGYLSSPITPKPDAGKTLYEDDDWQKVDTGRLSLRWRLSNDFELTLSHAQQDQLAHGTTGAQLLPATGNPGRYQAPLAFNDHTILSPYDEYADRDFRLSAIELNWKLPFGRLVSSTSVYEDSRVGQADYLATGSFFYGDLGYARYRLGSSSWSGNTAYLTFDNTYKGTVHETRIVSNPGDFVDWIGGVYFAKQKKSLQFSENLPTLPTRGPDGVGYYENQANDYDEKALFGELSIKPVKDLTLTAGLRVFNFEDTVTTQVEDYAFDLVTGVVQASTKKTKTYGKLNLSWQATSDFLAYATFSQGFRRGGANGFRNQSAPVNDDIRNYQPDNTDNLELGVKGFLLDQMLYLQTNVYRIKWKRPQTYFSQEINDFPVWGTTNGPSALSQGFEWNGRLNLGSWQFGLGSTYNTAKWDETRTICLYADNTVCRTFEKGGVLGGSPKWKHFASIRWETELDNGIGLNATAKMRRLGKKPSDRGDSPDATVFTYQPTNTLNAAVGLSWANWEAQLWAENLRDNRELVSFQGTSTVGNRTGVRAIYQTPRTVGLNLSYSFK